MFQTPGLEHTSASNAGFITGLTVVFTPVLGAVFLGQRIPAIARTAAAVSAAGLYLLSGVGSGLELGGDGLVLLCAIAFAAHILVTARGVAEHDAGALLVVQLAVVGVFCLVVAAASGELTVPRGATVWSALLVTSLWPARSASLSRPTPSATPPGAHGAHPRNRAGVCGTVRLLLAGERLGLVSWLGAALILAAIVAVELVPRLRPPRPLPGG
ncbi:MAG: EamA family transporter [Thermoleophilaceae bacterium]